MKSAINKIFAHKKNLLAVTVGQIFAAAGTLFGVRLLTEFIPPSIFGEYKLSLAAISMITGIFIRPFIQFVMREYHDAEKEGILSPFIHQVRILFRNYIIIISALLGLVAGLYITKFFSMSFLAIIALILVFAFRNSVELERAIMVTGNRQVDASLVSVARNWLVPISIAIVALMIDKTLSIMLSATFVVLFFIFFTQRYFSISIDGTKVPEQLYTKKNKTLLSAIHFGAPLAAVGLLSWIVHESDRFFLSYYHSEEVVGIYSAAYGLVSAPFTLVVGSMAQFLYPIVFKVSAQGDEKKNLYVLKAMLITSILVCTFGVIIVGLFDEQIARIALGDQYREKATGLLFWIALGYGFLAISMNYDLSAYGSKRTIDMFLSYTIAAVVNISMNIVLIPNYGAKGAVIATLLSLISYFLGMSSLFYYRNFRGFNGFNRSR